MTEPCVHIACLEPAHYAVGALSNPKRACAVHALDICRNDPHSGIRRIVRPEPVPVVGHCPTCRCEDSER